MRIDDDGYWFATPPNDKERLQMTHSHCAPYPIQPAHQSLNNGALTRPIRTKNNYLQFEFSDLKSQKAFENGWRDQNRSLSVAVLLTPDGNLAEYKWDQRLLY